MENPSMSQIKKLKMCVWDMLTINNEISLCDHKKDGRVEWGRDCRGQDWSRHRVDAPLVSVLRQSSAWELSTESRFGQFTVRSRIIVRYLHDVEMQRKLARSKINQML